MASLAKVWAARRRLRVRGAVGDDSTRVEAMLRNRDLLPVPEEERAWSGINYCFYWISDGVNLNTFMIAGSSIMPSEPGGLGLKWWQGWIAIILGYAIVGILVALSSRMGAVYHSPFPVVTRASFGVLGSFWPVINRVVLAIVWYGVQSAIGGQCVLLMLKTLAPHYEQNVPNHIPPSEEITSAGFLAFFIFCLASIPAVAARPQKIRHLFTLKAVVMPTAAFALFIWVIVRAKRTPAGISRLLNRPGLTGSKARWAFMRALVSGVANNSSLVLNMPDFARYAKHPRNVKWPQLITVPLTFGITSLLGVFITSSSLAIFPVESDDPTVQYNAMQQSFNPLDVVNKLLASEPYNPGMRAAIFFLSISFVIGQMGANISANSLSGGHDLAALLPRYLNVRRGALLCAALAFAIVPWRLISSSNKFTDYLSAYSMFLSAISGVIMADYYIVRRGRLDVSSLYTAGKSHSDGVPCDYWYSFGFHWRAYVAYFVGIAIPMPGFVETVSNGRVHIPQGAMHIYDIAYFVGFSVSALTYCVLCQISPPPGAYPLQHRRYEEPRPAWEADPDNPRDQAILSLLEYGDLSHLGQHPDKSESVDLEAAKDVGGDAPQADMEATHSSDEKSFESDGKTPSPDTSKPDVILYNAP